MSMKNKKVTVYETLRKNIIDGVFSEGTRIDEAQIAKEFNVSKTPLREALRQLQSEGFVENIPGWGSMVSRITPSDIHEIFEIREILECGSAKRAAVMEDKTELEKKIRECEVVNKNKSKPESDAHGWNYCNDIHLIIVDSLENKQLSRMYRELMDRIERIRNHFGKRFNNERIESIFSEHTEIVEAILTGDAEAAENMVKSHLVSASHYLIGLTLSKER